MNTEQSVRSLPDGWRSMLLGDVVKGGILGGNYPNTDTATPYPLIKMGNLDRGKINLDKIEYIVTGVRPHGKHRLKFGDVLFNTRNTPELVGKISIWLDELPLAYFNSNLMRLDFDPALLGSNQFANYLLNSGQLIRSMKEIATGTTSVAAIYTRDLWNLSLMLPPINEQRVIGEVLSDADALIKALDKLIAKKRAMKLGTMQQLLTGKTRLPGFSGEWGPVRLGDFSTMRSGGTPASTMKEFYDGSIPWVSISDMTSSGKYLSKSEKGLSQLGLKYSSAVLYAAPILLYAMYASLGETCIARQQVSSSQAILGISPNSDLDLEFLYYQMLSYREVVKTLGQQGTQSNLNKGMVQDFQVLVPPTLDEQKAVAQILTDMDGEIDALVARREKTALIKTGMMQELLTGRTRLV